MNGFNDSRIQEGDFELLGLLIEEQISRHKREERRLRKRYRRFSNRR